LKIFYVHNTPLAGLAALGYATAAKGESGLACIGEIPFLGLREHFLCAGRDPGGREVYAVWSKTDGKLLSRLIDSFCEMHHIPGDQYVVHRVSGIRDIQLRLVALAYRLGLFSLARLLLKRLEGSGESLVFHLVGVD
jgi:hypothetical protein